MFSVCILCCCCLDTLKPCFVTSDGCFGHFHFHCKLSVTSPCVLEEPFHMPVGCSRFPRLSPHPNPRNSIGWTHCHCCYNTAEIFGSEWIGLFLICWRDFINENTVWSWKQALQQLMLEHSLPTFSLLTAVLLPLEADDAIKLCPGRQC